MSPARTNRATPQKQVTAELQFQRTGERIFQNGAGVFGARAMVLFRLAIAVVTALRVATTPKAENGSSNPCWHVGSFHRVTQRPEITMRTYSILLISCATLLHV